MYVKFVTSQGHLVCILLGNILPLWQHELNKCNVLFVSFISSYVTLMYPVRIVLLGK